MDTNMLLSLILTTVVAAVVLLIVDRLNLGLTVGGFLNAIIAAVAIAAVGWLVNWLLVTLGVAMDANNFIGTIVQLVIAAVVLMGAAAIVPKFETKGFVGAMVAAIAIAACYWVINLFF